MGHSSLCLTTTGLREGINSITRRRTPTYGQFLLTGGRVHYPLTGLRTGHLYKKSLFQKGQENFLKLQTRKENLAWEYTGKEIWQRGMIEDYFAIALLIIT